MKKELPSNLWEPLAVCSEIRANWHFFSVPSLQKIFTPAFRRKIDNLMLFLLKKATTIKDPAVEVERLLSGDKNKSGGTRYFYGSPVFYSQELYQDLMVELGRKLNGIKSLKTVAVYGNYQQPTPGISDLDLILVIENECFSNYPNQTILQELLKLTKMHFSFNERMDPLKSVQN